MLSFLAVRFTFRVLLREALVYDWLKLPVGAVIPGPAFLEQADATTFIDPGLTGRVDDYGNVIVEREK